MTAPRRGGLVVALAATVVVIVLIAFGLRTVPLRTFALRVRDSIPVAVARTHSAACEGPVKSSGPARIVGIFGTATAGSPEVRVQVLSTRGRLLAAGPLGGANGAEHQATLDRAVPGGMSLRVCVRATHGTFTLLGDLARAPGVGTTGVNRGAQYALVLARRSTFLGALPTVFARAAIFKPRWVGAWTFWTLLGALIATIGLAIRAVASAGADDEEAENAW